jgi:hypothetical protein
MRSEVREEMNNKIRERLNDMSTKELINELMHCYSVCDDGELEDISVCFTGYYANDIEKEMDK